jgi:hypothetical protein
VTATTTQPIMPDTHLAGADDSMRGLLTFAQDVEPGTASVTGSVGDSRNALLLLTVTAILDGQAVTLPAARLNLLGDDDKIQAEQVIFYASSEL